MTKQFAHAFIQTNGPLMTEAIETIIGKRPETPDPIVRPLGVVESEEKREEMPVGLRPRHEFVVSSNHSAEGRSLGEDASPAEREQPGTGARLECEPENEAALSVRTAAASAPIPLFIAAGCEQ